jgi:hypothetical protein
MPDVPDQGAIWVVVTAVSGAVSALWYKVWDIAKKHTDCREEVAGLKAKDEEQGKQISKQADMIDNLQDQATRAMLRADLAETKVTATTRVLGVEHQVDSIVEASVNETKESLRKTQPGSPEDTD